LFCDAAGREANVSMKVTIIGAGNMGRAIGMRLVSGGDDVELIDHDPDDARLLADELNAQDDGHATVAENSRVTGDIALLALPYGAVDEALEQYGEQLAGKIVVDITNPIDVSAGDRLATPAESSAAEEIAKRLPEAKVVKAFNTTFAGTLVAGRVNGDPLDVFIAGDDPEAKEKVASIAKDGGLRPIDVGPLHRAQQLEHLGLLHIMLQDPLGANYGSAVKLIW
jgi:8-hydroxy-5-deazaflavin:NADPH oxidoreductase